MKNNKENIKRILTKKAPDILLTTGVITIIGGGLIGIRQTPKAIKILEENKEETKIEKVKKVAPLYIPSIILTGVGVGQIICSRNLTHKKIAAIATAYSLSETAFKTYKEKVKDIVEPDKYEQIKKEVADIKMKQDPIGNKEVIIKSKGDVLFYDSASGRYFKSTIEEIDRAVNILNKRMLNDMSISLNEFYAEIGLDPIKIGTDLGWKVEHDLIEVSTSATIAENGEPCIVLDYDIICI